LLRAADVHFAYRTGTPILRGVSVDVQPGTLTGILGPNGSGKSTLLRILAGILRPSRGTVTIDDVNLERIARKTVARRIAVVPQETHLAFDYTVLEVALMGRYPHLAAFEIEGPADFDIARNALRTTGTLGLADRLFATLGGGEKQRVIIAAALAQIAAPGSADHALLLLDEPTTALDVGYVLETANLLRDLQRERPLAIVVCTHDLNFAAALCDFLVLLKDGEIRATATTEAVLTPANIRAVYGVDAEVRYHDSARHLVVVPLGRVGTSPP
jgi:iron complex transport system ATP-binding protein